MKRERAIIVLIIAILCLAGIGFGLSRVGVIDGGVPKPGELSGTAPPERGSRRSFARPAIVRPLPDNAFASDDTGPAGPSEISVKNSAAVCGSFL